jgi:glucose-1-phosphate adenylyltransferase
VTFLDSASARSRLARDTDPAREVLLRPQLLEPAERLPRAAGVVLAGGEGRRLLPLTRNRSKPVVRFGGDHHLVDFALSNLLNGGIDRILVIGRSRGDDVTALIRELWTAPPRPQAARSNGAAVIRTCSGPYAGSAEALYRNLDDDALKGADHILVFAADHVNRLDPARLLETHIANRAAVTIAALPVRIDQATAFGVIDAERTGRIRGFEEKPAHPGAAPGKSAWALASMGIYAFEVGALERVLRLDARSAGSRHDIGGDIVPRLVATGAAFVYEFTADLVPGQTERERGYWMDVGTVDAYYRASMDLVVPDPPFRLDNAQWPIYFRHPERNASAESGLISALPGAGPGLRAAHDAVVRHSVVASGVLLGPGARVENSVLFDGVVVGRNATVSGAILGENVVIPDGAEVGPTGTRRGTVSSGGVLVVTAADRFAEIVAGHGPAGRHAGRGPAGRRAGRRFRSDGRERVRERSPAFRMPPRLQPHPRSVS